MKICKNQFSSWAEQKHEMLDLARRPKVANPCFGSGPPFLPLPHPSLPPPPLSAPGPRLQPRRGGGRSGGADSQADSAAGAQPAHARTGRRGAGRAGGRPAGGAALGGRGVAAAAQGTERRGSGRTPRRRSSLAGPGNPRCPARWPRQSLRPEGRRLPAQDRPGRRRAHGGGDQEGGPGCAGPLGPVPGRERLGRRPRPPLHTPPPGIPATPPPPSSTPPRSFAPAVQPGLASSRQPSHGASSGLGRARSRVAWGTSLLAPSTSLSACLFCDKLHQADCEPLEGSDRVSVDSASLGLKQSPGRGGGGLLFK